MAILEYSDILLQGSFETLYMTFFSVLFAYIIGLPLGVLVVVTDTKGIMPNKVINRVLGWVVNIGRSVPFIILMIALIPFTRFIVGKSIGSSAAIVPLVVAAAPFVARLIETSLHELDGTLIESAIAIGCSKWQIIYKVMLPETIPSIIRGISITTITLIGYSAMAGAIGGGGLGHIAISYGYHRYEYEVMLITIVILIIMVQLIQFLFNLLANKIDKKSR